MKLNKISTAVGISLCCSTFLIAGNAVAQNISGQVVNPMGSPIANAVVKVANKKRQAITDEQGNFMLENLPAGEFELHLSANNFSHNNFDVNVGEDNVEGLSLVLKPTVLEILDVYATPLHSSTIESAIPVNVLSGDDLKLKHASTLGETLKNEVGVHSTYYGPVASSPIIRGLDGPRVLITQNGLDVGDASRVGSDHSVSTETSTATQVEVLRGPATLFYGSGAIGGVVNVVDERVPTSTENQFDYVLQHNSVANENEASFNLNTGAGKVAFHLDGFWRDADDYSIPGYASVEDEDHHDEDDHEEDHEEEHHEEKGTLANSASKSSGFTVGSSYLLDNGYVGFSYGLLKREYGVPGHEHADDEHEHDLHEGDDDHEEEEEAVYADLTQQRFQILSDLTFEDQFINRLATKLAYTDYQHKEIEHGVVGTEFNNDMLEVRADAYHKNYMGWKGAWSLHFKESDFEAIGAEAFTPPSTTTALALAWLEEKHYGDVLLQLGARIEDVELSAKELSVDEHDHDHEHEEHALETLSFTPISASVGAVWDYQEGYNLGLSFAFSQRAPSASELFSNGEHIGTNSYEIGAIYQIHGEGEDAHLELNEQLPEIESSYNVDLTWRKFEGDFGFVISAFYNRINDYYYQENTGLFFEGDHGHEHGLTDEEHGLPVYIYQQADARLYGFEAEFAYQVSTSLKTSVFADYINAELVDGDSLPRTPPMRLGAELEYVGNNYSGQLSVSHYFDQDDIASYETETDGYSLVDVNFNYYLDGIGNDFVVFMKAENLLDTEARVHSSFLKDDAPLPGRNFSLGVRGSF
ncbi:TonB-dependent receptor [Thalassotalea sp. PLHSN55]|uniref:TonB-dependent receptor n=1 Tax=Thalassotalea sp. PLHSN55 TaxID=3435888 RepID=UPI003F82487A